MAILKTKDIEKMSDKERQEKLKDLKMELIKKKVSDKSKLKPGEIKKAIARILTFNKSQVLKESGELIAKQK